MTSTSTDHEYTNGRLILGQDDAFDLLDAMRGERLRLLVARGEMADERNTAAVAFYDQRLKRLQRVRRRIVRLVIEKEWGTVEDEA